MTPLTTPRYANGWGKRVFQLAVFSFLIKEKTGIGTVNPGFLLPDGNASQKRYIFDSGQAHLPIGLIQHPLRNSEGFFRAFLTAFL